MLATLFSGPYLIFLGLLIWSAAMMKIAAVKSRNSRNRNVTKELETAFRAKQRSAEGQLVQLEVRLHDYDRDVAARVATTMRMLDQLIAEADREILRLETLRDEKPSGRPAPLSAQDRRMVVHLAGAGYSIPEIARLIHQPEEIVARALKADPPSDHKAA